VTTYDAVVIGGGVNGITCAAMLGKRGLKTALVEQRDTLGGCAAEAEIAPGFRAPTLAHATGPIRRDVVEELQLQAHGLRFADSLIEVASLSPDGRALVILRDVQKTAEGLRAWSSKDADSWPSFMQSLQRISRLRHAELRREGDDLYLHPLSEQPTEVDGQKVAKGERARVMAGTVARLAGVVTLTFATTGAAGDEAHLETVGVSRPRS